MLLDINALEILAKVVSCYEETFITHRKKGTPHLSNTLLLFSYKDKKDDDKRISCHRCGNIRKKRFYCSRAPCPHVFCGGCADKMKEDYGPDVFVSGCPVCLDLCCCSNKSAACDRKNHCYRKCPASKSKPNDGTEIQRSSEYTEFKGLNFNPSQHDHSHDHADHDEGPTRHQLTHEYCLQGCGHNHDHNYDHEHTHEHADKRQKLTHSTTNALVTSILPALSPGQPSQPAKPLARPLRPSNPLTSTEQTPSTQSTSTSTFTSPFTLYPYNMMPFPNALPYTSTQPSPFLSVGGQPAGSSSSTGVTNSNTNGQMDPAMMAIMYSMTVPWLNPGDISSLLSTQVTSSFPYQPPVITSTSSSSIQHQGSLQPSSSHINSSVCPQPPGDTDSMPPLDHGGAFPTPYPTLLNNSPQYSTASPLASYPYSLGNNPLTSYPVFNTPNPQPLRSSAAPTATAMEKTGTVGGLYMNTLNTMSYPYLLPTIAPAAPISAHTHTQAPTPQRDIASAVTNGGDAAPTSTVKPMNNVRSSE